MKKEVIVKQDEQNPVPVEVLASSIKAISEGVRKLLAGPIKTDTLILLIQHASQKVGGRYSKHHVGYREIKSVLDGIESLAESHLKPKKAAK